MQSLIETGLTIESNPRIESATDYATILQFLGLEYKQIDYYLKVGDVATTQGWILHLSVIISQIGEMLQLVIPYLAKQQVSFKVVMHETAGEDILSGNFGLAQIGKIVSIYPKDDLTALALAKELIQLTIPFKGPSIPTDICLGNIVYTRYGSFNPVIKQTPNGNDEKYIYDDTGQLVRDPYAMPFRYPRGVTWPFKELAEPVLPDPPKYFNRIYKVLDILKEDPRGNVFKGLYLKSLFRVKKCVLKQGFKNSASDRFGRDIGDRLSWQAELYKQLANTVPLPIIYDLIHEPGFTLLVMEYLNAESLFQTPQDRNPFSCRYQDLPEKESQALLHYGAEITMIIERMHKKGYLHRDIVPVNFLVDRNDKLFLIDIELAYSLHNRQPKPPFALGTTGFMSPEQETKKDPSISQDIYSLGATLLYLLTGLTPIKFNIKNTERLSQNLYFFIGNKQIASLIADCLHPVPQNRPDTTMILSRLTSFKETLKRGKPTPHQPAQKLDPLQLKETILAAINGLTSLPIISENDLWYSKKITIENFTAHRCKQYSTYPGLAEGIGGPLYVLARLKKLGIDISSCMPMLRKGSRFIEQQYLTKIEELPPGLSRGTAGLALALAESINSGLIDNTDSNRINIQHCLEANNDLINFADGITGQGIALLRCNSLLHLEFTSQLVAKIANRLLSLQQRDYLWLNSFVRKKKKYPKIFDFNYDDTGIIWFLLEYISVYPNDEVKNSAKKALDKIVSNGQFMKAYYDFVASRTSYELGDGGHGMILTLLKAYEVLHENLYKQMAENVLSKFPPCIVNSNFSQQNGLAGMGEIYLEAWQALKSEEWKNRADWIANVYLHTFSSRSDDSGYWEMEQNNPPTADLSTGITGIIHFLARCLEPSKIGYRILN